MYRDNEIEQNTNHTVHSALLECLIYKTNKEVNENEKWKENND